MTALTAATKNYLTRQDKSLKKDSGEILKKHILLTKFRRDAEGRPGTFNSYKPCDMSLMSFLF